MLYGENDDGKLRAVKRRFEDGEHYTRQEHVPVFPPSQLSLGGRVEYITNGTPTLCALSPSILGHLKFDDWLHGEVLYAYFLLAASLDGSTIALDSSLLSLLQMLPDNRLTTYPLGVGRKAILPLNISNSH